MIQSNSVMTGSANNIGSMVENNDYNLSLPHINQSTSRNEVSGFGKISEIEGKESERRRFELEAMSSDIKIEK